MTAVNLYWLHKKASIPAESAVLAWPCFPTKLLVQGTGSVLTTGFPNSIQGWDSAWNWDGGGGDAAPCDLVMFRNMGEQPAQSTAVGPVARGQAWCIESRVGWSGDDVNWITVYPLRWTSGFYLKYTPTTRELILYVGSSVVFTTLLLPGLNSNVLHHWAATYNAGTIKIWINGALVTTYVGTMPDSAATGIVLRYDGGQVIVGELYVGGVRYWASEHYTAPFTPPTQLTIP